jgi:hypothetical protein
MMIFCEHCQKDVHPFHEAQEGRTFSGGMSGVSYAAKCPTCLSILQEPKDEEENEADSLVLPPVRSKLERPKPEPIAQKHSVTPIADADSLRTWIESRLFVIEAQLAQFQALTQEKHMLDALLSTMRSFDSNTTPPYS